MMVSMEIYSPAAAVVMLFLVWYFVPKEKFKELLWYGLTFGFIGNAFFLAMGGEVFSLFRWVNVHPFRFLGYSIWDDLLLIFMVIFFLNFLPKPTHKVMFWVYIMAFAVIHAMHDQIFHQVGLLNYYHWNPFFRFIMGLVWFFGIAWFFEYEHREKVVRDS